jgi:RNA polymerase sigma-70 factor (ECF subfamily)
MQREPPRWTLGSRRRLGVTANSGPVARSSAAWGEDELLGRARAGDQDAFALIAERFRAALPVHCYRIVGSVQDGEDPVHETMLAAWRGRNTFPRRSQVRSRLYRIATNRCLNACVPAPDTNRRRLRTPENPAAITR